MALNRLLRINVALAIAGAIVAIVWVRLIGGLGDLAGLGRIDPLFVLMLLSLTGASICVRFVRWHYLLRRAGVRLPTRPSLLIYLASLVGIATPGYVGEAVRAVLVRRRFGLPSRTTLFVLLFERFMDVVALALMAAATADGWWLRGLMAAILIATFVVALVSRSVAHAVGMPEPVVSAMRRADVLGTAFAMSLLAWLLTAPLIGVAASGLSLWIGPIASLRVFSSATLLGGLTLMPAGVGTTGTLAILQLQRLGLTLPDSVVIVSWLRLTTAGVTLVVGTVCLFLVFRATTAAALDAGAHFDEIAPDYGLQFSTHIWNHLLTRKVGMMAAALPAPSAAGRGLDLGCGLGAQCLALGARGYKVFGIDVARRLAAEARRAGAQVAAASAINLPFPDRSLDFVYAVGVLHHLADRAVQNQACREVGRVLAPGGKFLVHETNPRNPLFRFYMGYVFPVLKKIDEGTEWWIEPERWEAVPGLKLVNVQYFTFMPDFVPAWLMRPFMAVDLWLERSPFRRYSVHYMAVLERDPAWSPELASQPADAHGERVSQPRVAPVQAASGALR